MGSRVQEPYPRESVETITENLLVVFFPRPSVVFILQFEVGLLPITSRIQLKESTISCTVTLDELGDSLVNATDDSTRSRAYTLTLASDLGSVVCGEAMSDSTNMAELDQ